ALPGVRFRAPHGILDARPLRGHPGVRAVAGPPALVRSRARRRPRRERSAIAPRSDPRRRLTRPVGACAFPRAPNAYNRRRAMDSTLLLDLYRQMCLCRRFEEAAAKAYSQGKVSGFLHLYIGQEAVAAGAISAAEPTDY